MKAAYGRRANTILPNANDVVDRFDIINGMSVAFT
ncbi:hypothetical protein B1132_00255 [Enterococcus faecium]|nr:hypothetical protein B1132_00255 [Enterococcus faecium]